MHSIKITIRVIAIKKSILAFIKNSGMQIKSKITRANNSAISDSFQKIIWALVVDVVIHSGSFETRKKLLKKYCEDENLIYPELENNLRLFLELLEDYNKTNDSRLYRFLKLQAQFCFIDESNFDFLLAPPIYHENNDKTQISNDSGSQKPITSSSTSNGGIVGGHLIGL